MTTTAPVPVTDHICLDGHVYITCRCRVLRLRQRRPSRWDDPQPGRVTIGYPGDGETP